MAYTNILKSRSTCVKYQTATIIVNGTQIIALGYNGTFSGKDECVDYWFKQHVDGILNVLDQHNTVQPEERMNMATSIANTSFDTWVQTDEFRTLHRIWSAKHEVHAEINALNWVSKKDITADYALYTYYSPCDNCAKAIISYGIKQVYYNKVYRNGEEALKTLEDNGVICRLIE